MKVSELANELGKTSKEVLDIVKQKDQSASLFAASSLSGDQEAMVRAAVSQKKEAPKASENGAKAEPAKKKLTAVFRPQNAQQQIKRPVPKRLRKRKLLSQQLPKQRLLQQRDQRLSLRREPGQERTAAVIQEARCAARTVTDALEPAEAKEESAIQETAVRAVLEETEKEAVMEEAAASETEKGTAMEEAAVSETEKETVTEETAVSEETETAVRAVLETVTEEAAVLVRIRTEIPEVRETVTAAEETEETQDVLLPLTARSRQSQAVPVRPIRTLIRMTVSTRETGKRTARRHQRQERELSLCRSLRRKRPRWRILRRSLCLSA